MRQILRQVFKGVTLEDDEIAYLEVVRGEPAKDKKSSIAQDMKMHGQAISVETNIRLVTDALLAGMLAKLTFDAVPVLEAVDLIRMVGHAVQSPYDFVAQGRGDLFAGIFVAAAAGLDIKARGLAEKQKQICFPELADEHTQMAQP